MARHPVAGRTVLITGSTGGLGSGLAAELRRRGARLVLLDLDEAATAAQAESLGGPSVAFGARADVRSLAELTEAAHRAREHFGRIDVVVANAGVETMAPLATIDPAEFERVVDINLHGVWRTFRAALPHVLEQRGYLLGISSMAAFIHSPLHAPYTASKAGVWALCDSIRLELKASGVRVGSVHPTFFRSPMMERTHADPAGRQLWGGNTGLLWQMIGQEPVVRAVADGIERRAKRVVVPRRLAPVARMPGLAQPVVDLIGFRRATVQRAAEAASPSASAGGPQPLR